MQFLVRVTIALPFRERAGTIENRWQLSLRPFGIVFPQTATEVGENVRNADGEEVSDRFARGKKFPAGHFLVVNDVENFAINTRC